MREDLGGNRKGCDIGYVPAICSCEGAGRVDPCTVAALDAIAAFAVPNPSSSSQSQPVFSGLVARSRSPWRADHSAYFGLARFISPILSAVDGRQIKQLLE
jgi:hypothetical protein